MATKASSSPGVTSRLGMANGMCINSNMDGGNIEVVDMQQADNIQLRIIPDPWCETDQRSHFQWFSFRVTGAQGKQLNMHITNAGEASYAVAWQDYRACASYDMQDWFRVPTTWDAASGRLSISMAPDKDMVHIAYFAPFSMERHYAMMHRTQMCEKVTLKVLGHTLDGRDMQLLQIGDAAPHKRKVWIIARQHPGETMASWFMEGLLQRVTDPHDPVSCALLNTCTLFCVPHMCPDGAAWGHLRTNAAGVNLNRAWAAPDAATAPEVDCVLRAMDAQGLDMLVDVHGDEELPYNFVAGLDGIPGWSPRLEHLQAAFKAAFMKHSPDFQVTHGYATDLPGKANLNLCSKQIGQRFDALSLTLEMPFKDNADMPNARTGWSPQRAAHLGAAMLGAIHDVAAQLR